MKRLIALFFILAFPFQTFAAFSFYRTITVDKTKVGGTVAAPVNFPVLVDGVYPYLANVVNGGKIQSANNAYDLGFYTSSDCATGKMNWEMEKHATSTGTITYWVKAAALSTTTNTVFYMCYGDSSITTDQSSPASVWDSNFIAVYHASSTLSSAVSLNDSTSNVRTLAIGIGTPTVTSGQIDGAAAFATNQGLTGPSTGYFKNLSAYTISAWTSTPSLPGSALHGDSPIFEPVANVNSSIRAYLGIDNGIFAVASGNHRFQFSTRAGDSTSTRRDAAGSTEISVNTRYFAVGVYNGASGNTLYVNGGVDGTIAHTDGTVANTSPFAAPEINQEVGAANNTGANYVDELRISNVARSADWITTEYNSESATSTFYTVGSETAVTISSLINAFHRFIFFRGFNFVFSKGFTFKFQ